MTRILFVDDEQSVLDGLRNVLRKQRRHWEMAFALGGQAALDHLALAPVDVIVSDMRMPGMDGAALLGRVKEWYPRVARIILSGHAEPDALMRAAAVAHQSLSKPCDADLLRVVVQRSSALNDLLHREGLGEWTARLAGVPSLPGVHARLGQAIARPHRISEIAALVETDPAVSGGVLTLARYACAGTPWPMASLTEAATYLGADPFKALALTANLFAALEAVAGADPSLRRWQAQALATARLAARLADRAERATEAFVAGLLHEIGGLVLALTAPDELARIERTAQASGQPRHTVEREVLGVTHAEIGAHLLAGWGLPFATVEAVAYHHSPALVSEGSRELLAIVHVAAALAGPPQAESSALDLAFLDQVGLGPRLPAWRALAGEI